MKRLAGITVVAVLGIAFIAGNGAEKNQPRIIEAEKFILRDEAGKKRGAFEMTNQGPSLTLYDDKEKERIVVFASDKEKVGVSLLDKKGNPSLTLFTSNNDNASGVFLTDANGIPRLSLFSAKDLYGLSLWDENGQPLYTIPDTLPSKTTKQIPPAQKQVTTGSITATKEFEYKNVRFRDSYGNAEAIGEITNNSGRSYNMATLKMSVYDQNGDLLGIGDIIIANFENGQTKSFDATFLEVNYNLISKYKIDFEFGI
jgi:hypothetical protein